jgi:hypothetical protein
VFATKLGNTKNGFARAHLCDGDRAARGHLHAILRAFLSLHGWAHSHNNFEVARGLGRLIGFRHVAA